jgi:hypothetical protein
LTESVEQRALPVNHFLPPLLLGAAPSLGS